ncbi:MAG: DUF1822 family protein [Scytonema sp. PMC 1069.18]|nr:DUF1822 family protein [Scytonema sp. PMC 1069.18]MEC4885828.1 DUF1822 family protein [Scytonema sp. PMC 1070.18]
MTFDSALVAFADPTQLCLEIPEVVQIQASQHSQAFSTPSRRWNAYLNQICLGTFLPWLQEEHAPKATPSPSMTAQKSIWEVVNGTAVVWGTTRLVLIPTEEISMNELHVPQEWVDIPTWAADYYLGVQVNTDEGWIRIVGYTTHEKLKTQGRYDAGDRIYSLDEEALIPDLNVLWVTRQLCPNESTRVAIAPLQTLPIERAENMLQRLGNTSVKTPRLAVPFQIWGALLEHSGWRQRLYELRQGLQEQWSLVRWLSSGVSDLAQQVGWGRMELESGLAGGRGLEQMRSQLILSRRLNIAGQPYELRIQPLGRPEDYRWRIELRAGLGRQIPTGFKLRLLMEDLQPFANNEDTAVAPVDQLYIDVAFEQPGEGLVWEIEPSPENYEREILRF